MAARGQSEALPSQVVAFANNRGVLIRNKERSTREEAHERSTRLCAVRIRTATLQYHKSSGTLYIYNQPFTKTCNIRHLEALSLSTSCYLEATAPSWSSPALTRRRRRRRRLMGKLIEGVARPQGGHQALKAKATRKLRPTPRKGTAALSYSDNMAASFVFSCPFAVDFVSIHRRWLRRVREGSEQEGGLLGREEEQGLWGPFVPDPASAEESTYRSSAPS